MPTTYKCPSCGAAMEFDSDTQKMKCPQCQRIMDVSEFDMDAADGNYDENTGLSDTVSDTEFILYNKEV